VIIRIIRPGAGYRYIIEAIIFLTYVLFGMTWSAAGSFLGEIMQDLGIGLSRASFINTSVSAAKILGPIVAGALSARLKLKRAFLAASFLISLGVLAPVSSSFWAILAARFLMGLGGALVVVYFTPIVMEWFDEQERVVVNGLNFVSISVGMTFGLAFTEEIRGLLGGSWRATLLLYSSVSIVLFLLWLFLGKDRGGDGVGIGVPRKERPSKDTVLRGERAGEMGMEVPPEQKGSLGQALRDINTWKLILCYFGLLSVYLVMITYAPQYYRRSGVFEATSPVYLAPSIALISSIPAAFLGIWISRRSGRRIPLLRISGALIVPGVLVMFFSLRVVPVFAGAVLTGFGMFFWRPALFSIPQELPGSTPVKSGYMMSVFWAVCYSLATVATWLTGRIIEASGNYAAGFIVVTVLSASLLIGSFTVPETGRRPGAGS
jgi:cyanate permease